MWIERLTARKTSSPTNAGSGDVKMRPYSCTTPVLSWRPGWVEGCTLLCLCILYTARPVEASSVERQRAFFFFSFFKFLNVKAWCLLEQILACIWPCIFFFFFNFTSTRGLSCWVWTRTRQAAVATCLSGFNLLSFVWGGGPQGPGFVPPLLKTEILCQASMNLVVLTGQATPAGTGQTTMSA